MSAMQPEGWYPDTQMPNTQRYWDGAQWTEHTAPLQAAVQPAGAYSPAVVMTSDQRTNGVEVAFAWVITILTLGYMLPWAIAATRGKSNSGAIALLSLLLGWTFVGWIVAMVMACGAHQSTTVIRS